MPGSRKGAQELDEAKKNRIIGELKFANSYAEVARAEHVPESTVRSIYTRYKARGTTENLPRSGRKSKLSGPGDRYLTRLARKNRRIPFKELGNLVTPAVSQSTVRRKLASQGYHRRVARKGPYLSNTAKLIRCRWAMQFRKVGWRYFEDVVFSDESYIYIGGNAGRIFVTRKDDEEFEQDCMIPTFKQSSIRIMVWGCIALGYKGPLISLKYEGGRGGGMSAKKYQEQVLDGPMLSFFQELRKK